MIDRDEASYTVHALRRMKQEHEELCAAEIRNNVSAGTPTEDLFSIGPDVVCLGDVIRIEESAWHLRISHYVKGGNW